VENLTFTGAGDFAGTGNRGANTITSGDGADILDGKAGADTLIGGDGSDTYIVDNAGDQVIEAAGGGIDTVQTSVDYTLGEHVENLELIGSRSVSGTGNDLDNHITGNRGANVLDGGAGADILEGGAGNDTYLITDFADIIVEHSGEGRDTVSTSLDAFSLADIDHVENLTYTGSANFAGTGNALTNAITGGDGNDVLDGGQGADILRGGLGDDVYYVDNAHDRVYESFDSGIDTVYSSVDYRLRSNLENLTLTGEATTGAGNGLNNILIGNDADNTLSGGAGADRLIGLGGDDLLRGGSGSDTFVFTPGFGHDIVAGFSASGATHDILEIDDSIFADLSDLLDNATQVGANVEIAVDADTSITLQHVNKNALTTNNVHIVNDFDFS
jgi:Ca2+-binding RTX toxin-like protein